MAADSQGNVFLIGSAASGIPVTLGAAQGTPGGGICLYSNGFFDYPAPCLDAFIAKVRSGTGKVVFATYLGGDLGDAGTGIALDPAGNIYVTGTTGGDFPTTSNALLPSASSGIFVAKLNPQGTKFLYSTYLPGTASSLPGVSGFTPWQYGQTPSIAVDAQGNAYVTGNTVSNQAFVAKINPDGSSLLYNTVLGGTGLAAGIALAVDAAGNAYVTGVTGASDFPVTANAFETKFKACPQGSSPACQGIGIYEPSPTPNNLLPTRGEPRASRATR